MISEENRLPLSFYEAYDTRTLAQKLLGCELVHNSPEGLTSGIIVETEAYLQDDPACHAYRKRTARTEPMYSAAGTIYVYLIYGMYQCVNIVSREDGCAEAVLIRALQPTEGIELMEMRRRFSRKNLLPGFVPKPVALRELCKGPGKLVQAMGIDRSIHNAQSLDTSSLYIRPQILGHFEIEISKRIGITQGADLLYRYTVKNNRFVSK
ncbi:DNA-3-methyladenine glycosylase [Dyadobacter koreensis]|uniref:Putative 3-methyladenine DNA glycosylase n=1 Tax=Dyadobacter koreensis TaxID=408657 RepID=A0A1H6XX86_9BACT|nr:DNA-3-methyladenine glycosylase [Dyadobacter koreensis]SEJ32786.1 DNA-3-methyladenine glycosylase [Dyadobacter koreensis]